MSTLKRNCSLCKFVTVIHMSLLSDRIYLPAYPDIIIALLPGYARVSKTYTTKVWKKTELIIRRLVWFVDSYWILCLRVLSGTYE